MAAKEVRFGGDGRQRMPRGADILTDAAKVTLSPKRSQRGTRQKRRERSSLANPAHSGTARHSRRECCRPRWRGLDANLPDPMTVIARWSPFSPSCSRMDCRRSTPPARRRYATALTHPM
jgi:hypothetical protein